MKHKRILAAAVLAVTGFASIAAAICGSSAVCTDVINSMVGEIQTGVVTITWSTSHENSSIGRFELKRYNCSNPATCSVDVATITPSGTCDQNQNYSYSDTPPAPASQWTFILEVWRVDNSLACAVTNKPQ